MSRIPILMYHEVAPGDFPNFRKYVVSPSAFRRQMSMIASLGYKPISFDDLLAVRQGGAVPRRPIVITFDDGFAGAIEYAAPILRSHDFTATFFVVTDLVGARSSWLRPERRVELPLFGWADAAVLVRHGFSVQSHSVTHPRLSHLDDARLLDELQRSRLTIEDHIGMPATHLAYPYGSVDQRVRQLAGEVGYTSACGVHIGLSTGGDDPLMLPRLPVEGDLGLAAFVARLTFGLRPREMYGALRRKLRIGPSERPGR